MSNNSKKLLIVFNSLDIGGIERKIVDIANHYSTKISVTLILRHKIGPLLNELNPQVKVIESSLYPPLLTLKMLTIRPNLILTFGNFCSICTILSYPFSKIIISEDSSIDQQMELDSHPIIRKALVKLTYPLATKIIALTTTGKNKLLKIINKDTVSILPNWLPLTIKPTKSTKKTIDILFLGRLVPQKNPLLFLRICQKLSSLKITMVGSGVLEPQIRNYIKQHHLSIQLFPATAKPSKYYQKSKILLITSVHEGFPLTVLEATANHCLPVCKNIPELLNYFNYQPNKIIFNQNPILKITYLLKNQKTLDTLTSYYQQKVITNQLVNFNKTIDFLNKYL